LKPSDQVQSFTPQALSPYPYMQIRHSGIPSGAQVDCRNPDYKDVLSLPSMVLDTRFPAGMTAFMYKGMINPVTSGWTGFVNPSITFF